MYVDRENKRQQDEVGQREDQHPILAADSGRLKLPSLTWTLVSLQKGVKTLDWSFQQ